MQLYAFDAKKQLISAHHATKKTDYQCLECKQIVRLRGGPQRQRHFFHLEPTPFCRQHQKGPVHLQLQMYLLQRLPLGDCQLECSFPSINRIADVAWSSQKIIFEIQCSPITPEEVLARNRDYQKLGWQVVWILHDQRYNQMRLSAAEWALRSSPHFFSNMNHLGEGIIYDQFDICDKGIRLRRLPALPVNLTEVSSICQKQSYPLILLERRAQTWNLSFTGDLFGATSDCDYLNQAIEIEKDFYAASRRRLPFIMWHKLIMRPYRIFFRFLLERMCR